MQGELTSFWGKLDLDGDVVRAWHPLEHHCADVAACAEALLTRTLIGRRLARLAGRDALDEVTIARLCVLVALHDLGKFNQGFQNKGRLGAAPRVGHVRELMPLFDGQGRAESEKFFEALAPLELSTWGDDDVAWNILIAAVAHHGRPIPADHPGVSFDPSLWTRRHGLDPFAGMRGLVELAMQWFPRHRGATPTLPSSPAFQHGFAGLVMLADWLGSDRSHFPFSDSLDADRIETSRPAAARALRAFGIETGHLRDDPREVHWSRFCDVTEPRAMQAEMLTLPTPRDGSVVVLESETGSGKTEAALAHFFRLFAAGSVEGLYFALPTRTAATQMFRRVRDAVERYFSGAGSKPPVVLAVPGYLEVDHARGQRLPAFETLWKDDSDRSRSAQELRHRGWAAENPKRYLAAAISVGTIDQALLSALTVDHGHLRATALTRSLLVVDEVHASDAYMNRILRAVLTHHRAAGGHALLMSATLGSEARERLLEGQPRSSLAPAREIPYPRIAWSGPAGEGPPRVPGEAGLPKRVGVVVSADIDDPEAIARRSLEAARRGARVLVVRNTVSGCLAVQRALEDLSKDPSLLFSARGVIAPHHARYAKVDREALDEAIELAFGKAAPAGGRVCVATQTVQQSLDLDADLMLTDLCPMDVLLQRIGRLFRHARVRPPGFTPARCEVLVPAKPLESYIRRDGTAMGPHGMGTVYDDLRVLHATWELLRREPELELEIPRMNRQLVEDTTHREALAAVTPDSPAWAKHAHTMRGSLYADHRLADDVIVDRSEVFGVARFRDLGDDQRVSTRLGQGDRLVELSPGGCQSPFGSRVHRLSVAAHLARGVGDDAEVHDVVEADGCISFRFGDVRFRYDRHGLHREVTPTDAAQ